MPGDSCIFQLLSIVHEINSPLDSNSTIDVRVVFLRGVFLNISKAFDKVWHEGLLFKLESHGIGGELLNLFKDYLQERQQRVVLNGHSSSDDTSLFSFVHDKYLLRDGLNSDFRKISDWTLQWKMKFNPDPNKQAQEVHFLNRTNIDKSLSKTFNNSEVETIASQKHLGLILDERLNFNEHLESKINKCYKIIGFLKRLSNKLPHDAFLRI